MARGAVWALRGDMVGAFCDVGAVDIPVTLSYLAWYQALFFKMSVP